MEGYVVNVKKKVCVAALFFLMAAPLSVRAAQALTWYPMESTTTPPAEVSTVPPSVDASSGQIAELMKKMSASPGQDGLLTSLIQQQSAMTTLLTTMSQQQAANSQANLLMAFMAMKPEQQQAFIALMALQPQKQLPAMPANKEALVPYSKNIPALAAEKKESILPSTPSKPLKRTDPARPAEPIGEGSIMSRVNKIMNDHSSPLAVDLAPTISPTVTSPTATPAVVIIETPQKSVVASIQDAYQDGLRDANPTGAEAGFSYAPSQIYTVWCKEGYLTDVRLQPGEELQYIGGGDTIRWLVDKAVSGSGTNRQWHVYLKPLRGSIETNIIINTDRRSYQLFAKTDGAGYNPMVAWLYPQDQLDKLNKELERNATISRSLPNRGQVAPEALDFNYQVSTSSGAKNWTPVSVYNDGQKTYLKMPAEMAYDEAPALFVKDGRNGLMLVNYRIRKGVYIIDRLFQQAELRNGKNTIKIQRSAGRDK